MAVVLFIFSSSGPLLSNWFIRGDADGSGSRNIADAILLIRAVYHADQTSLGCLDAADIDGNGKIEITDAIALLQYLFVAGPRPWPEPLFPGCWFDDAGGSLGCEESEACSPVGLFFVCDKSGSMGENAKFNTLRQDLIKDITWLSADDQFAVIFFDVDLVMHPSSGEPVNATSEAKAAATAYVIRETTGQGWSCAEPALLAALDFAERSTAREKVILFFSDGDAYCPGSDQAAYKQQVLAGLSAKNTGGVRIDCIGVGPRNESSQVWLKELAAQNGGSYARIR